MYLCSKLMLRCGVNRRSHIFYFIFYSQQDIYFFLFILFYFLLLLNVIVGSFACSKMKGGYHFLNLFIYKCLHCKRHEFERLTKIKFQYNKFALFFRFSSKVNERNMVQKYDILSKFFLYILVVYVVTIKRDGGIQVAFQYSNSLFNFHFMILHTLSQQEMLQKMFC